MTTKNLPTELYYDILKHLNKVDDFIKFATLDKFHNKVFDIYKD